MTFLLSDLKVRRALCRRRSPGSCRVSRGEGSTGRGQADVMESAVAGWGAGQGSASALSLSVRHL